VGLVAVGIIAASVAAAVLSVVVLKRLQRRSSFAVGDRVRVVGDGLVAGRIGTIEEGGIGPIVPTAGWMVRFDGAPSAVRVPERSLQHLPLAEFPDAKKPPAE
jgi:hypothetical protein